MKARILDVEALNAVTPVALRAYIDFEGWRKVEQYGAHSLVYGRPENSKSEILVPFTTEIADYAPAVGQVIKLLARFEDRDELAVYSDVVQSDRDVIRFRAPEAEDDGSIAVDAGRDIVEQARNLLASAACSAFEPRRAYHLGKVQQAEDYMRRVRLGQTEHGSFVITLLAPIPPALTSQKQISLWPALDQEPYERQVTRVLSQALHAAHAAILASNRGDGLSAFSEGVGLGVSANLCEAVAAIVEQTGRVDLSVTWARTRPTPTPRDRISFSRSDAEILKEVGRQFRLKEPRIDERVMGYITQLRRDQEQFDGRITLKALVDGRVRSLMADLTMQDYQTALRAHALRAPITILGNLEREGQRWRLASPRELSIIQDEES